MASLPLCTQWLSSFGPKTPLGFLCCFGSIMDASFPPHSIIFLNSLKSYCQSSWIILPFSFPLVISGQGVEKDPRPALPFCHHSHHTAVIQTLVCLLNCFPCQPSPTCPNLPRLLPPLEHCSLCTVKTLSFSSL